LNLPKSASKVRLLQKICAQDGTELPKVDEFTDDVAQLYYKSNIQLKEQLRLRNLPPIRGMKKKLVIERIIKHDGHEVPQKKPRNPNKVAKVKSARPRISRRRPKKLKVLKDKLNPSFATYIYKVLKQVHPDAGISTKAMVIMNDFTNDILRRVGKEAQTLCELFKKKGQCLLERSKQQFALLSKESWQSMQYLREPRL